MNAGFVPFDEIWRRARAVLEQQGALPEPPPSLYLVRDLFGKVRISVSDEFDTDAHRAALRTLADRLHGELGAHSYPPDRAVLFVSNALLETLKQTEKELEGLPGVYRADRLVTGSDWWTIGDARDGSAARRCTLFSVKGGVGRSTTAAVLAWRLARDGERVLAVDLDLESPGLSSALLEPDRRPQFGVTDWFVEDLVGQGDGVLDNMLAAPAWMQDLEGDVRVAPAHGANPGDYLAKLGRVYMDRGGVPWTKRLENLLFHLEEEFKPTVVLLESRSGLHDIAAATVTDLDAEVLLFATDSESTWTDYGILFRHWNDQGLATKIRERLSIVSALTPVPDREAYMRRFRSRAWDLFREYLYDELDADKPDADKLDAEDRPGEYFSFDLDEADAPHARLEIGWTPGLAAGASLRNLDKAAVMAAYGRFLKPFVERVFPTADREQP